MESQIRDHESQMPKVYPIVKYGDPVLEKPAEPVTVFDATLKQLIEDMFESMYAAHGVGLAAPQIGHALRLVAVDCTDHPKAKSCHGLLVDRKSTRLNSSHRT